MTKAKLTVKSKTESDLGAIQYTTVELLDADGVMKEYGIKDYHDHDGIFDTEIEDMTTGEDVYIDSTLGKRICVALEEYNSDERDSMTYEDAHVNDIPGFEGTLEALDNILPSSDIVVPCSAELDNQMYNESI